MLKCLLPSRVLKMVLYCRKCFINDIAIIIDTAMKDIEDDNQLERNLTTKPLWTLGAPASKIKSLIDEVKNR